MCYCAAPTDIKKLPLKGNFRQGSSDLENLEKLELSRNIKLGPESQRKVREFRKIAQSQGMFSEMWHQ